MSPYRVFLAATVLAWATAADAGARDSGGFLEASENPLLGTWLLSEEGINPNMPIRCSNLRLTFTHRPWLYNQIAPNQVAVGRATYTIIDHDHMLIDEIPKCWYQRGPINGTTPLLTRMQAEAEAEAQRQSATQPLAPLPRPTTAEDAPIAAECMGDKRKPGCMTFDEAVEQINGMGNEEPASATANSPELQRSLDQLQRAIQELQERARQQSGR